MAVCVSISHDYLVASGEQIYGLLSRIAATEHTDLLYHRASAGPRLGLLVSICPVTA